jgi:hypothetical protein
MDRSVEARLEPSLHRILGSVQRKLGCPRSSDSPAQSHYVQALYHLTKTLDPTRPVIGNDGGESVATDMIGIHDYDDQPARIAKR